MALEMMPVLDMTAAGVSGLLKKCADIGLEALAHVDMNVKFDIARIFGAEEHVVVRIVVRFAFPTLMAQAHHHHHQHSLLHHAAHALHRRL
jgi:hypothetical protein